MLRLGAIAVMIPVLALAQGPTFTLLDLGPADDPNGTGWPDAECLATDAGTDSAGHALLTCRSWEYDRNGTLEYLHAWVGYAQLPVSGSQRPELNRQPVEYYDTCCGKPPPYQGLKRLSLPAGVASAGEAISLSQGAEYVVGYSSRSGTTASGGSDLTRRAILWTNEQPRQLPALAGSNSRFDSAAYAVNGWGEAVGESETAVNGSGYAERATLWIGESPHELQYLLAAGSASVILTTARWIDCAGNIGAQGFPSALSPYPGSSDYPHNYLLMRQGAARSCPQ